MDATRFEKVNINGTSWSPSFTFLNEKFGARYYDVRFADYIPNTLRVARSVTVQIEFSLYNGAIKVLGVTVAKGGEKRDIPQSHEVVEPFVDEAHALVRENLKTNSEWVRAALAPKLDK